MVPKWVKDFLHEKNDENDIPCSKPVSFTSLIQYIRQFHAFYSTMLKRLKAMLYQVRSTTHFLAQSRHTILLHLFLLFSLSEILHTYNSQSIVRNYYVYSN